jgi:hypothetical protein
MRLGPLTGCAGMKRRLEIGLRSALAAGFLASAGCAAYAQDQPETQRQRDACTPDAHRWCQVYIPNRDAITDCLKRNLDNLTRDCRLVMQGKLR